MLLDNLYVVLETFLRSSGLMNDGVCLEKCSGENGILVRITPDPSAASINRAPKNAEADFDTGDHVKIKYEEGVHHMRNDGQTNNRNSGFAGSNKTGHKTRKMGNSPGNPKMMRKKLSELNLPGFEEKVDSLVDDWYFDVVPFSAICGEDAVRETQEETKSNCVVKVEMHHPSEIRESTQTSVDSNKDDNYHDIEIPISIDGDKEECVGSSDEKRAHSKRSTRCSKGEKKIVDEGDGVLTCTNCPMILINQKEFLKHYLKNHIENDEVFPCPYCSKRLTCRVEFRRHVNTFHPFNVLEKNKPIQEPNEELSSVTGFTDSPTKPVRYVKTCRKCNLSFSNYVESRRHFYEAHALPKQRDGQAVNCPICEKQFFHHWKMWEHKKLVHERAKYRHKCSQCDFTAKFPSYVKKHEQIRHGERRFPCLLCNKKFQVPSALRRHFDRIHRKLLSYECTSCNKKFFHEIGLRRHSKANHRVSCHSCSLIFVNKKDMVEHYKEVHGGEGDSLTTKVMPYRCAVCYKGFEFTKPWRDHIKAPHRFNCTECSLKFVFKKDLLHHWNKLHCSKDGKFRNPLEGANAKL